jgi:hypothetical protein
MAAKFIHDFSLCASVTVSNEEFEDAPVERIIEALENRLADLKRHPEHWREYVDHFATNEEIQ